MAVPRSWDVFCHVVDNFGDAAVCWRLARALVALPATQQVRLWIDELEVLHALVPEIAPGVAQQSYAAVEVCRLVEEPCFGAPADVAVDGFGGGLPEVYAEAMVERVPRPLWIVLEYLSAEPWVPGHHGLPSPHPHLPLERYFFFPGFGAGTGGLLREEGFAARRAAFLNDPKRRAALWRDAGVAPPAKDARLVTLFGYEGAPLGELLDAWAGAEPVWLAVPPSPLASEVAAFLGASGAAGQSRRRGALQAAFLPFLPQDRYDELLWAADWNFVRGEDSFVQAQWAERPFTWQLYPQSEAAHLPKLDAFLGVYCAGLPAEMAAPLGTLFRGWNGVSLQPGELRRTWAALTRHREALRLHAREWAARVAEAGELAMNLASFCAERLK